MNKDNLSLREISLIWIFILLLTGLICANVFIVPSIKEYRDADMALRELELEKIVTQMELERLADLHEQIEADSIVLKEQMHLYDIFKQYEDIEYDITYYLLNNNNTPTGLFIGYVAKDSEAFSGYIPARAYDILPEDVGGLLKFNVRVLMRGRFTDMLSLLDYINDSYSYRLIGMNLSAGNDVSESSGSYTMEVVLRY